MRDIFILLRVHQWLKNIFVFLPLFFDRQLTVWSNLSICITAFFSFSFAASSIYCFNDIYDVEKDRTHPKKCKRPIASGSLSKHMGYLLMIICAGLSLLIALFIPAMVRHNLLIIIAFYYMLNIFYCIRLKQIALVDVFIIAFGFVLRILIGGVATGISISQWIVLMTFLLALFLAFAKRRDDVVIYEGTGLKPRRNVNRYNLQFMNQAISIIASITMMCYIMYTVSDEVVERMHTSYLYGTSVFVLAGIMRYLQITIVDVKSGSPTKVLMTDRFIQICIVGWVATFYVILYC